MNIRLGKIGGQMAVKALSQLQKFQSGLKSRSIHSHLGIRNRPNSTESAKVEEPAMTLSCGGTKKQIRKAMSILKNYEKTIGGEPGLYDPCVLEDGLLGFDTFRNDLSIRECIKKLAREKAILIRIDNGEERKISSLVQLNSFHQLMQQ